MNRYTDCVNEIRNTKGEEYGEERLISFFQSLVEYSAAEIKEKLIDQFKSFCGDAKPHDDSTFVVIKVENS